MLRLRDIALRLLPLLVVVWATVAVLGGAIHLAKSANPPEAAAKAGLGLCAVSVAIIAGKAARRVAVPPLLAWLRRVPILPSPRATMVRRAFLRPPPTGPPILLLLQVSRT